MEYKVNGDWLDGDIWGLAKKVMMLLELKICTKNKDSNKYLPMYNTSKFYLKKNEQ